MFVHTAATRCVHHSRTRRRPTWDSAPGDCPQGRFAVHVLEVGVLGAHHPFLLRHTAIDPLVGVVEEALPLRLILGHARGGTSACLEACPHTFALLEGFGHPAREALGIDPQRICSIGLLEVWELGADDASVTVGAGTLRELAGK